MITDHRYELKVAGSGPRRWASRLAAACATRCLLR
jgi:hypothetical protein